MKRSFIVLSLTLTLAVLVPGISILHHSITPKLGRLLSSQRLSSQTLGACLRSSDIILLKNNRIFDFVVDALHSVFEDIGIPHSVATTTTPGSNATYITFLTHALEIPLPPNYISYNFEQLTTDKQWPEAVFERYRAAQMVWDYSLENIKVMKAHGVNKTVHIPLGYAPNMENKLPPLPHKDVDVMFVGALNPKRQSKLRPLHTASHNGSKLSTVLEGTFWGDDLLKLYRRSKVGLNLHFYGGRTILEVHRILPMLASKVLVLSERSDDLWLDNEYRDLVNFTSGEDLLVLVSALLNLPEGEAEKRYQRLLACCSYKTYFLKVLGNPVATAL